LRVVDVETEGVHERREYGFRLEAEDVRAKVVDVECDRDSSVRVLARRAESKSEYTPVASFS